MANGGTYTVVAHTSNLQTARPEVDRILMVHARIHMSATYSFLSMCQVTRNVPHNRYWGPTIRRMAEESDRIRRGWTAAAGGRLVRDNRRTRTAALVWGSQHAVQDMGSIAGFEEIVHNG